MIVSHGCGSRRFDRHTVAKVLLLNEVADEGVYMGQATCRLNNDPQKCISDNSSSMLPVLDNISQYHTARLITRHGKNGKSNISKDKAFLLQEITEELLFFVSYGFVILWLIRSFTSGSDAYISLWRWSMKIVTCLNL